MEVFDKWLSAELKPFKRDFDQIKVTKQRCLGCSSKLITWILDFDPQFTYPDWELGKCNDCGKLNLIQIENARSFQPKTFTLIKSFKRSEFSKEAVLNELLKLEKK
ncbi:MAG: hypothetical protein JNK41_09585 [Saprospiraceae bacterium]|nr:hypothetical protein [Saprospiraceae bacterium]